MPRLPDLEAVSRLLEAVADPRRLRVVMELARAGELTLAGIAEILGVDSRRAAYHVEAMVKGGALMRVGRGRYRLTRAAAAIARALAASLPGEPAEVALDGSRECVHGFLASLVGPGAPPEVLREVEEVLRSFPLPLVQPEIVASLLVSSLVRRGMHSRALWACSSLIYVPRESLSSPEAVVRRLCRGLTANVAAAMLPERWLEAAMEGRIRVDPLAPVFSPERLVISSPCEVPPYAYEALLVLRHVEDASWAKSVVAGCPRWVRVTLRVDSRLLAEKGAELVEEIGGCRANFVVEVAVGDEPIPQSPVKELLERLGSVILCSAEELVFGDGLRAPGGQRVILASMEVDCKALDPRDVSELATAFARYARAKAGLCGEGAVYVSLDPGEVSLKDPVGFLKPYIEALRGARAAVLRPLPLDLSSYRAVAKLAEGGIYPLPYGVVSRQDIAVAARLVKSGSVAAVILR